MGPAVLGTHSCVSGEYPILTKDTEDLEAIMTQSKTLTLKPFLVFQQSSKHLLLFLCVCLFLFSQTSG